MAKMNLDATITFVANRNPRRLGAAGYNCWDHYQVGLTLTEVIRAINAAGLATGNPVRASQATAKDHVRWDLKHGALRVEKATETAKPIDPTELVANDVVAAAILGGDVDQVAREPVEQPAQPTRRQRGRRTAVAA